MKKYAFLTLLLITSNSMAALNYDPVCTANLLQAYNSDIFYNLSPAEIAAIIADPQDASYSTVLNAAKQCEIKPACK